MEQENKFSNMIDELKYDYNLLIDVLNGMFDENQIANHDKINWDKLAIGATKSIIEKLYELNNDTQRKGFLNHIFLNFFNEGKDYNLDLVKREGAKACESKLDFEYLDSCITVLNGVILDISEVCLAYDDLDFTKVIQYSIRTSGIYDNHSFIWYSKDTVNPFDRHINKWFKVEQSVAQGPLNIKAVEEKQTETFISYLSHTQKVQLAESLKKEFENDRVGKSFALMIKSLQNRKILNLTIGSYSKLYDAIEIYFDRKIGSETALNKIKAALKTNFDAYKEDFISIDNRVEIVINTVEKEKKGCESCIKLRTTFHNLTSNNKAKTNTKICETLKNAILWY